MRNHVGSISLLSVFFLFFFPLLGEMVLVPRDIPVFAHREDADGCPGGDGRLGGAQF